MHPYRRLGSRHFWATGVAQNGPDTAELWTPKQPIGPEDAVVTFGSCFAQHFGRALKERGYSWLVTEPGPPPLTPDSRRKFNYDIFSARTGNIYTTSMLRQWVSWAQDPDMIPDEVWASDGRFYDPFRPTIEPNGFASVDEVLTSRRHACKAFGGAFKRTKVFVFTLGLTESWFNAESGHEYPVCPGTAAGQFDPAVHRFVNQDYAFIRETLMDAIGRMREANPDIRILLTVSPVPLTATMSGNHVLVATTESKAILRAVAGSLAREMDHVDYFPSYEIISSHAFKGMFFEANQRTVSKAGVGTVMACFFDSLDRKFGNAPTAAASADSDAPSSSQRATNRELTDEDAICEELLLEAFAPKA